MAANSRRKMRKSAAKAMAKSLTPAPELVYYNPFAEPMTPEDLERLKSYMEKNPKLMETMDTALATWDSLSQEGE